jgi:methionyl-tRNA formyltransferase
MRTVFFGTPDWAVPSLKALAESAHRPVLIVTQPAKRRGRGEQRTGSPVALEGERLGVPRIEPASARDPGLLPRLVEMNADLFVVVAYGEILQRTLLEAPPHGCVNVHFSLLPRYRGAAPVQWALANGETTTGVTTMRIVPKLDAGPIYLQEEVAIDPGEHAPALGARLSEIGARLLVETIDRLERGPLVPREQDPSAASSARMLKAEDGWIDWTLPAEERPRVRAFDPWPGQSTSAASGRIKVLEARVASGPEAGGGSALPPAETAADHAAPLRPGSVLGAEEDACVVACGAGTAIALVTVRPGGKRSMTGAEALGGRHLSAREVLVGPTNGQA